MQQPGLDIQRADKNQQFAANLSQLSLELSNFDIDLRNILERRLMSYSGLHLADTMQRFEISYSIDNWSHCRTVWQQLFRRVSKL